MKGIIIYKGKYGATRQYADWLSKELNLQIAHPGNYIKEYIADSDYVIIGSSVYIGKLQIKEWVKQNVPSLRTKKIFLFVVCGTPPDQIEKLQPYVDGSIPPELRNQCQVYFMPGKLIYQNLSWSDKFMLRMGAFLAKEKKTKKAMLTDYDDVKKEYLDPLIRDVKAFSTVATRSKTPQLQ